MKRAAAGVTLLASLAFAAPAWAASTMRVDYYHTGNSKAEQFSLDRIVIEPLPWPGHPKRTVDDTNLGKYFFEVVDAESGTVLYSRGFSSIYGEWETTARHVHRARVVRGAGRSADEAAGVG